ncbi:PQQ-binding-like beta-propeller repeat protein [Paenibacillus donghaensis]|nr:PQQ-binding-like beta-propeller repeat protein [Paenibacillus donghaensis]
MTIQRFRSAALAGLAVLLLSVPVEAAGINPHTSYIANNWESSVNTPVVKPLWSLAVDNPVINDYRNDPVLAVIGGSKVFTLQKGQLFAVNSTTGTTSWKAGAQLVGPLFYDQDRVYASSTSGAIYAFNASSGKRVWTSSVKLKNIQQLQLSGNQLYAYAEGNLHAFGVKDGIRKWTDDYEYTVNGNLLFAGDVILAEGEESGAYTYSVLHAFDRKTGKRLWHQMNYGLPIAVQGNTVVIQKTATLLEMQPLTTLDTLDLKTGKVLKTVKYNPENIDLTKEDVLSSGGRAWISNDRIYINSGDKVYGYDLTADPAKVTRDSFFAQGSVNKAQFAAGPADDRLIFSDGGSGLYGVKLADKSTINYSGLTNPIARFDLIGHGMYVAQTDGKLVAIHLVTAKPVLQLQTGARVFGQTLSVNGMIIVQAQGKLIAFKEPAMLKK